MSSGIGVDFTFDVDSSELSGEFDCTVVVEAQVEVELEGVVRVAPPWWARFSSLEGEER